VDWPLVLLHSLLGVRKGIQPIQLSSPWTFN